MQTMQRMGWKIASQRPATAKQASAIVYHMIGGGHGDFFPQCNKLRPTKRGGKVLVNETRLRAERWLRNNLNAQEASRVIDALMGQRYMEAQTLLIHYGYEATKLI